MADISTSTVAYATRNTTGQLVFIASDGSVCVLWCDGTNQVRSYDDNSYASWTKATLTTGLNMALAGHFRLGTDNIDEVTGSTSNVRGNYRLLTKSGATWTVGASNVLSGTTAIGVTAQGSPTNYIGQDAQGRHWIVVSGATNTLETCYYSAANSPTTTGWTASGAVTQTADLFTPAADQVGNYLIKIYWNGTALQWHRVDNSGASVGSWTTGATIANLTGSPNASSAVNFKAISATQGLLTYSSSSGIYAQLYDVSSNTFGAATQLSSDANDRHPTIAIDGAGNAWVVYCKYAAANSFSLVYKKYNGASWGTETELVASGTNINYPNAGFGYKTLGVAYTQGTASPYTVGWASQMFGGAEAITGVSAALSGPMALTLYGSATPDAVLPNACDVATVAGGVETSKVSTFSSGSGNFAEVWSKGGSFAAVSVIPTNPTGYGWGYQPGAGTFNGATPWDAIITCSTADNSGSWRLRFFKFDGAATYTPITTLTTAITATAKTIYNFPASTVAPVDFLATDWLVWDLYYETLYGAALNTVTCYEATTSAAGVANEMQITTPVFTPASTGTTYSQSLTGVSAAFLQTTSEAITGVSLASKQSGISKSLVGVSAALGVSVTTYSKTITSVSSAFIQTNTKTISGVSGCFKATVSSPITSLSSALKSLNNAKNISSVSAAIGQSAIPVTITSVSAAFKALGVTKSVVLLSAAVLQPNIPKTITSVSSAVLQPNITKTISGVSTALSLLYARNLTGVSAAFIQTTIKTSVSISAVIAVTTTKNISSVSVAVLATVAKNSVSISSVLKALGVSLNLLSVSAAIGQGAIPRNITGISVSVKSLNNTKTLTSVSVALLQSNITKNISGVFSALVFTGTKSVSSVSGSFLSLSNPKALTSISGAFVQTGIQKTISFVSASVQASANAKTISGVSAVVSLTNTKTLANTSAALKAVNLSRSLVGVSVSLVREKSIVSVSGAFKATNTLTLTSVKSAIGQSGIESQITSVSAAFIQTNRKTLTPVSLAVQQVGIARNVTGVKVTLVQTYLKTITNSSAALKALGVAQRLTFVSVVVQKRNIARQIENVSANFTYIGEYLYVIVKASRDEITVSGLTDKVVAQATRGELAVKRATIKI